MKKLFVFTIACAISGLATAAVVETKFKVTSRYYDEFGETRKLPKTRAYVRYNNAVDIMSPLAKEDCLVSSGKNDIFSLFTESENAQCVSSQNFVITTNDIVKEMFFRPFMFSLRDDLYIYQGIDANGGVITSSTARDVGDLGLLRLIIRNLFNGIAKTQTISLVGPTIFTFKGTGKSKIVMELEPVKTIILNN